MVLCTSEVTHFDYAGVPSTSDSLAYEPFQQLLALGTSEGRIKVIGKQGVEKTLQSASKRPYGTRQLLFLPNCGVLVRVSEVRGTQWVQIHANVFEKVP